MGTKTIYTASEQQVVHIAKHAHDHKTSILKHVREEHPETSNQLDDWRALKQLEKSLKHDIRSTEEKLGHYIV